MAMHRSQWIERARDKVGSVQSFSSLYIWSSQNGVIIFIEEKKGVGR